MEPAETPTPSTDSASTAKPAVPQFRTGAELARWTLENDNQGRALDLHPSRG